MRDVSNEHQPYRYRRILGVALVCVVALLALHHLVLHNDDDHCSLCVLLSNALVVAFTVVALVVPVRRSFVPVQSGIPPLHTGTWTAWSHRGPPLHS